MNRSRAFAAIIKNDLILMVEESYPNHTFWTLPGGGLEKGESFEEAVVREVKEEVNLDVRVIKFLFSNQYELGEERCYLVELVDDQEPILGYDPEAGSNQTLSDVKWHSLKSMKYDLHVSKVLQSLKISI
ncbi:NUDIX domain-containing protein [Bacillus sp. AK128]